MLAHYLKALPLTLQHRVPLRGYAILSLATLYLAVACQEPAPPPAREAPVEEEEAAVGSDAGVDTAKAVDNAASTAKESGFLSNGGKPIPKPIQTPSGANSYKAERVDLGLRDPAFLGGERRCVPRVALLQPIEEPVEARLSGRVSGQRLLPVAPAPDERPRPSRSCSHPSWWPVNTFTH